MLLLQLYSAIGAIILAWLNRIPCIKMRNFGASIREEKEWHRINAAIKIFIAYWEASFIKYRWPSNLSIDWHLFFVFLLILLIMWTIFDVVLSKLIHDGWFYIGTTSKLDKSFRKIFGVREGLWKFVICLFLIGVFNYINHFL